MSRKIKSKLPLVALVVFLLVISFRFIIQYNGLDDLQSNLRSVIFKPETEYAKKYSDSGFRTVQEGMTKPQVIKLLGEPLYTNIDFRNPGPEERWWYSRSSGSRGHYRMREVRFLDNHVSEKIHYVYVD